MPIILWDASALVKRYCFEEGTRTVAALFALPSNPTMVVSIAGFAEMYSILVRKRNGGVLDREAYLDARHMLREDAFDAGRISVSDVTYDDVLDGIAFIERHNINSSDAAILASYARHIAGRAESFLLIASDRRLLRAARSESFDTLDPESVAPTDLPRLLADLP